MYNNFFIYFTSFFCGMSIMAVELSATRLLAPYFGTSQIIWTVVIGLIMISLSLGNILGGKLADKVGSMDKLFKMIWIASAWIALIPLGGRYVIAMSIYMFMWILPDNLLVSGSIFSSLVIFSFPLVILGMASPFLVKLGVRSIENMGRTTGRIYALSTIGSIIGTFIPTFLTIPNIGTSKTFFIFSLILNVLCLYHFIVNREGKRFRLAINSASAVIILMLVMVPVNTSYAFWQKNILEEESLYNYLRVTEDANSVILSTNAAIGVQSIYKKDDSLSGYYYEYALMAPFFIRDMDFHKKSDILVLGFGTGTFSKQCKKFFPNSVHDGVEIDRKIVNLAAEHFNLKKEEASVYVNDGRTFLMGREAKMYDLILVDAYHDITIPFHMATREFFQEAKKHLKKNGVLMININMRPEKNTKIMDYLTQTLKSVMKKAYKCDIQCVTNTIVIASDDENCRLHYSENIRNLDTKHPLYDISRYVDGNLVEISGSECILTDEVAPVEILGQRVLDELIGNEVSFARHKIISSGKGIRTVPELFR